MRLVTENREMWEIWVPCEMRGKPVRTRHHKSWDKYVYRITGGLTILGKAKGKWVDPSSNTLHEESMIKVQIGCTQAQIKQIAEFTIKHYHQIAVMFYQLGTKVFMLYAE